MLGALLISLVAVGEYGTRFMQYVFVSLLAGAVAMYATACDKTAGANMPDKVFVPQPVTVTEIIYSNQTRRVVLPNNDAATDAFTPLVSAESIVGLCDNPSSWAWNGASLSLFA